MNNSNGEFHQFEYTSASHERLDCFLVFCLQHITRSRIQALVREGFVSVNEKVILKTGYSLAKGDRVSILVPQIQQIQLLPESIPLNIVFENDRVIIVDKPAGMVVHPSVGHDSHTLVNALLSHISVTDCWNEIHKPGIVHRLDKDTSGLILVAKDSASQLWLQHQFANRKVEKTYLALVDGHPPTPMGRIQASISRDPSHRKRMSLASPGKGRDAVTEYFTLKKFSKHTYLKVRPLTGRTHQIRVHLASIQCPVVGDQLYGRKSPSLPINRHFLHAHFMRIILPGENQPREFTAELPNDLQQLLNELDKSTR